MRMLVGVVVSCGVLVWGIYWWLRAPKDLEQSVSTAWQKEQLRGRR